MIFKYGNPGCPCCGGSPCPDGCPDCDCDGCEDYTPSLIKCPECSGGSLTSNRLIKVCVTSAITTCYPGPCDTRQLSVGWEVMMVLEHASPSGGCRWHGYGLEGGGPPSGKTFHARLWSPTATGGGWEFHLYTVCWVPHPGVNEYDTVFKKEGFYSFDCDSCNLFNNDLGSGDCGTLVGPNNTIYRARGYGGQVTLAPCGPGGGETT